MKAHVFLLLIAAIILCSAVSAVPITNPMTLQGNNMMNFTGTGVTGTVGWFQWGMAYGQSWSHTPNITPVAGTITYTMKGAPILGCTTYYYRACDPTGCGAEVSFMTLAVTRLPVPDYDKIANNITENGFDPLNVLYNSGGAYTRVSGDTFFYGIIFAMIFVGMWWRTRGTQTATAFGMICIGLFASSAIGLGVGLPPEFLAAGQALMYLSLTGAILSFTFK
jgi:hypothetical protein